MNNTFDIYEQNIITPRYNYNISKTKFDLSTSRYINTKRLYPYIEHNFNYTLFQKENKLHKTKDISFNSCVYANSKFGTIGCLQESYDLYKNYFIKNKNINKNIIKCLNNDINIINNKSI